MRVKSHVALKMLNVGVNVQVTFPHAGQGQVATV